jgi:L-iduronidase
MKYLLFLCPIWLLLACELETINSNYSVKYEIDLAGEKTEFPPMWRSTGFTPAEMIFTPSMQLTLDNISITAFNGIVYFRPHYLLNLVGSRNIGTPRVEYNWTLLDQVLDEHVARGQKLIFEVMGYPSSSWEVQSAEFDAAYQGQTNSEVYYFNDFEDPKQLREYKDMVSQLFLHLIDRYGREEILSWYFEVTNEPDIIHFWTKGIPALLNYYDAVTLAIEEIDPEIRYGGPGTARGLSPEFKQFVAHCDTGTNYFTGKPAIKPDFISVHRKAKPYVMIDQELEIYSYLKQNHPSLLSLPFMNDEADPIAGWSRNFWWRPLPWYAAFVVQSVDLHHQVMIDSLGLDYPILSNDNGFMGFWGQRTHFTRFIRNMEEQNNPDSLFYLVKKPVYTVMSLLGFMGKQRHAAVSTDSSKSYIGLISTEREDGTIAIMAYNAPDFRINYEIEPSMNMDAADSANFFGKDETVLVQLNNMPFVKGKVSQFLLDREHGNPYQHWLEMGSPEKITAEQYLQLWEQQEPVLVQKAEGVDFKNGHELSVNLQPGSVTLILIAPENAEAPELVEAVSHKFYRGFHGEPYLFMDFQAADRQSAMAYDVYFSTGEESDFQKINPQPLINSGFMHLWQPEVTNGSYKIKSIGFDGQESEFSSVFTVTPRQDEP